MKRRVSCRAAVALCSLALAACAEKTPPPAPPAVQVEVPAPVPPELAHVEEPAPVQPEAPAQDSEAAARERLQCEALLGFRALMAGQTRYFAEKDQWTGDVAQLKAPAACPDGARVATPDATWLAGCHFRYAVSVSGTLPSQTTYSLQAVGVGGAAEGLTYAMTDGYADDAPVREWPAELALEACHGVRQPEGTALPPPVCEAALGLRSLFVAQKAYFQEYDRYSTSAAQLGFAPEPCLDGSRAPVPDAGWTAGCHFTYRAELSGATPAEATFLLTARDAAGEELQLDSSSRWSPAEPDCVR